MFKQRIFMMKNTFLYIVTVLIWGTTWFAIEFQLGDVAVEISLIYRFALAAMTILLISKLKGLTLNFNATQHFYMALLGLFNFCINYYLLYEAQQYLTSAMTSIGFSMLLLVNIINSRIFFAKKIMAKTYFGASFGILGIITLFWPELAQYFNHHENNDTLIGLAYVLSGVLFASFGNMISVRNSNHDYPVFQTSGWAMLYGTLFLVLIAWFKGTPFTISIKPDYLISLGYLVIFGTVIAFYSYFYLLKSIGPEKASYSIVLFPVISVFISSLYEGFEWNQYTVMGFILVAFGNLIMLLPEKILNLFKIQSRAIKLKTMTFNQAPLGPQGKARNLDNP